MDINKRNYCGKFEKYLPETRMIRNENCYATESTLHSPYSKEKRPDVSIWFDVDEKKKE